MEAGQDEVLSAEALPLALSQREVWLDHCAWPGSAHLNIGGGAFLLGSLELPAFRQALRALVAETEALRLVPQNNGSQKLLTHFEPALEEIDVSSVADPRQAMREAWQQRMRRPFELGQQPPWRFILLHGGPALHGLSIQFHHTVMDGWGTTQVMRRWSELHNAILTGQEAQPQRGESYLRFVEDTNAYRNSPAYGRDAAYWQRQLDLSSNTLPQQLLEPLIETRAHTVHHAVAQRLPPSHMVSQYLDTAAYARLSAKAAAAGLTPFICFLAGLALYLSRSSGRGEMLIGVPCLNRAGQRFRPTPGMFVGVLPLHLRPQQCANAKDLLTHVAQQLAEGMRHARYPMSELGRQLQLMRHGRDSLLEVMVSFERQGYDLLFGEARLTSSRQLFAGWARYPLAVTVCEFETAGPPELVVEASSASFAADEAALLGRRLWWTAQQLIAELERPLNEISVMPETEQQALIEGLHKDLAHLEDPPVFIAQFEQQAALRPDARALLWDEGELSYGELDQRARRLAVELQAAGAAPECIVALALPRSPEMVIAMLAVAKAGAAFLPLSPEMPASRLADILKDSSALALLLPADDESELTGLHPLVLRVPPVSRALEGETPLFAGPGASPDQLAYVLYTSGSSGAPKGVLMPHASLSRRLAWLARSWGIDSSDRSAQTTQPTFDPALIELLLPLTVGASVALPPPGRLHPCKLAEFILRHGATFCALVPATLAGLLNGLQNKENLKLRVACCGGETLPAELARRFISETGARLYNVYGPTEAAIFATAWPCQPGTTNATLPLGRPIDDTRIYVLDEALRPQPFGVSGEIFIGGEALARGYLGRPDLDAEHFLTDPFRQSGRMYRTGDRGWIDAQGLLHFGGRADRQIKLRGYRIEPGDIETALQAIHGVERAFVSKVELDGCPRLHAWVATGTHAISPADLRAALRERLPDFMVPGTLSILPALPLTATGKIDARSLPAPLALPVSARPARAPLSALEQQLLVLWQQALGRLTISPQDNFFDLGGDSLAALDILSAMEERLKRPLPLQLISEHPSIKQLARALAQPQVLPGVIQSLGSGGAAVPLYIAASGHGDVLRFQTLARALHGVLDLHMLQPPREQAPANLPDLAERYADSITAQGLPPGWIAGFSVAGVAALETARVLQRRGQPAQGLLLLDTIHPDAVLGGTSSWRTLSWLVRRLKIQDLSMNGRRLGAMFSDPGLVAQVLALRSYRCSAVDGPVLLIKSTGLSNWSWLFFRVWQRLIPQLSMAEVPGLHGSFFEPAQVTELARAIQQFTGAGSIATPGEKI